MHPIWQSNHLSWKQVLSTFRFQLFFHSFRIHLHNSVSWNGIVLVIGRFFLILIASDNLQIVRSKNLCIDLLDAVYEFNWSCVTVLRKERYSHIPSLDCFEDIAHRFVNEESILNLALRLLSALTVQSLYNLCVIRFRSRRLLDFLLIITMLIAGFEQTWHLRGSKGFSDSRRRKIFRMWEGQIIILEFLLDIEFVKLVIDGVICFFGNREERIIRVFETLLLLFLLFKQFFKLNQKSFTSSLSDLSAFSRFIP